MTPDPGGYAPDPVLVTIGDISVTSEYVLSPQGRVPVGQVYWTLTDQSRTTSEIPTWAIVLAIVFAVFCLLGLLFLLVKEERTTGWAQVGVQGPGFFHATQLPVTSPYDMARYQDMVNYARSVTASRSGR
ncbi:hypothetical protein GCM10023200_58240 [Actinomycetospora chlora]|uniref:ResB-like domain-containing protein n=1 Tax=Actinomycetospora chlora TaxID=663608 RepID=A0ABP9CLJ4_9PSEU